MLLDVVLFTPPLTQAYQQWRDQCQLTEGHLFDAAAIHPDDTWPICDYCGQTVPCISLYVRWVSWCIVTTMLIRVYVMQQLVCRHTESGRILRQLSCSIGRQPDHSL